MYRLLVSDDGAEITLLNMMLGDLPADLQLGGTGPLLKNLQPAFATTIEQAKSVIAARGENPSLLLLGATVRRERTDLNSSDGGPACEFLHSIRGKNIPTLVISSSSQEKLLPEVILRPNVAVWQPGTRPELFDLDKSREAFSGIITNLCSPNRSYHVTVSVGDALATYKIIDGQHEYSFEWAYFDKHVVAQTIRAMERFRPYDNGMLRKGWQQELCDWGCTTYGFLIKHAIGTGLLEAMEDSRQIDIQFNVDELSKVRGPGELNLFELPFEATNHSTRADEFFCVRVPMARRVRPDGRSLAWQAPVDRPLRMLVVLGGSGGSAGLQSEATGGLSMEEMKPLERFEEFREFLDELKSDCALEIEILDGSKAQGKEFIKALRKFLEDGQFDIVHFYGHSANRGEDGTFLFAPGDTVDRANAVNIRAICKWMAELREKKSVPFLVFLSSCESGSARTAVEMMKSGVEYVLGFRWQVEEEFAIAYIKEFYTEHLKKKSEVRKAYWLACKEIQSMHMGQPEWASAILLN
ncbi:CHAT domain-containing protein [Bradyrhizobium sp. 1]|uniref:CHAT domain-containing protein n=1 Tax=Bradyrhizobium sp. 1 TaxID=241591 RepID=UPI001FF820D5|nr:CHAT domain-containing protein [Bradyrhizobium sp. 1]MCK1396499.1 CHAT domain-containing protein [Bradyrhizobium sp. 1]